MQVQAIPLSGVPSSERLVKRTALIAFRALRTLAAQVQKAPVLVQQVSVDLRQAWEESALPKS